MTLFLGQFWPNKKKGKNMKIVLDLDPRKEADLKKTMLQKGLNLTVQDLCFQLFVFGMMHYENDLPGSNIDEYLSALNENKFGN